MSAPIAIVIPCYNEAARLHVESFEGFLVGQDDVRFILVNDGSTDGTLEVLNGLAQLSPERFEVIDLGRNCGKAEAVRRGMVHGFESDARCCGYWDADLATPLEAIPEFARVLRDKPQIEMVFGSRVKLLGRSVQRKLRRHYLGRVFATAASIALRLAIYDTQCGAKLFRNSVGNRRLFAEPFISRWIFDVEIIARAIAIRRGTDLAQAEGIIYEFPLRRWHDVGGSKLKPWDFPRALFELVAIYQRYLS